MAFTANGYYVSQFTANGLYLSTVVIRNFLTVNSFYGLRLKFVIFYA